jgi:lysophospholipase L1-like esterase
MGVMTAAIAGNRVLSDATCRHHAQARFDHHVAVQPGATHMIFMEEINDIGQARENPTPFYGAAYYSEVGEAKRQAVNQRIRPSNAYDAVIDFDKVTRDPADPKKFLAAYDSCDHLHPSDAGYKAMADAIDLALFRTGQAATSASVR